MKNVSQVQVSLFFKQKKEKNAHGKNLHTISTQLDGTIAWNFSFLYSTLIIHNCWMDGEMNMCVVYYDLHKDSIVDDSLPYR